MAMLAVRSTVVDAGGAVSIAVTGAGGAAAVVADGVSVGVWAALPVVSALVVAPDDALEDEVALPEVGTVGASGSAAMVTVWVAGADISTAGAPDATEVTVGVVVATEEERVAVWLAVSVTTEALDDVVCASGEAVTVNVALVLAVSAGTEEVITCAVVCTSGGTLATAEVGVVSVCETCGVCRAAGVVAVTACAWVVAAGTLVEGL